MNKVILFLCLVMVGLLGFNTFLLVQMSGKMMELKEKIEPAAKSLEKVQPALQELSAKKDAMPISKLAPGNGKQPESMKEKLESVQNKATKVLEKSGSNTVPESTTPEGEENTSPPTKNRPLFPKLPLK